MKKNLHYIISFNVIDKETEHEPYPTYHVATLIAFSTKDQYLEGKKYAFGLAGSGWVSPKYRNQPPVKFGMWYMKILMLINMEIRYCYAHVFAENVRSLGYISKSGMIPTKFRLKFLSFTQNIFSQSLEETLNISSNTRHTDVPQSIVHINSLPEYKDLMHSIYGNSNFLIGKLENIFNHPSFAGCYVDKRAKLTFQLWKCKYSLNQQTQEQVVGFVVFNVSSLDGCDVPLKDSQCRGMMQQLEKVVLPFLMTAEKRIFASTVTFIKKPLCMHCHVFVNLGDYFVQIFFC